MKFRLTLDKTIREPASKREASQDSRIDDADRGKKVTRYRLMFDVDTQSKQKEQGGNHHRCSRSNVAEKTKGEHRRYAFDTADFHSSSHNAAPPHSSYAPSSTEERTESWVTSHGSSTTAHSPVVTKAQVLVDIYNNHHLKLERGVAGLRETCGNCKRQQKKGGGTFSDVTHKTTGEDRKARVTDWLSIDEEPQPPSSLHKEGIKAPGSRFRPPQTSTVDQRHKQPYSTRVTNYSSNHVADSHYHFLQGPEQPPTGRRAESKQRTKATTATAIPSREPLIPPPRRQSSTVEEEYYRTTKASRAPSPTDHWTKGYWAPPTPDHQINRHHHASWKSVVSEMDHYKASLYDNAEQAYYSNRNNNPAQDYEYSVPTQEELDEIEARLFAAGNGDWDIAISELNEFESIQPHQEQARIWEVDSATAEDIEQQQATEAFFTPAKTENECPSSGKGYHNEPMYSSRDRTQEYAYHEPTQEELEEIEARLFVAWNREWGGVMSEQEDCEQERARIWEVDPATAEEIERQRSAGWSWTE
ncbi:hypothetical protein QBC35DRAFT_458945 [Podospora australis]|uniref:Uncharacterized protein n=1 Tax=Podospora australis TaxID=1536484 RepID=A0AAN6X308_9PEZI|nr:hypothetical protein QBC35DRAFT_458945 [Podospora australis]